MAIEGLRTQPQPRAVNGLDDVGAAVEALEMLGLVRDRDQVTEYVAAEYKALGQAGRPGELYIQLPRSLITLEGLIEVSDAGVYARKHPNSYICHALLTPAGRKYPNSYVSNALWTPGANPGGYQAEELDNLTPGQQEANWAPHARLAVHNQDFRSEPLLHFLDKPFDKKYAQEGEQTQLDAVTEAIQTYEAEQHEGFVMTPLNAKAVAMIGLIRRIKGQAMPLQWGFMLDATLVRKTVDGKSSVGYVECLYNRLGLYGSSGSANPGIGVGLSVGPEELKLQAS